MSRLLQRKGWRTIFADRASAYDVDSFGADDGFMAGLVYSFLEDTVSATAPVLR